jgi:hypothetical protein
VDDIVICSQTHEEHMIHVRQVLQHKGLVINTEKCMWGVPELEYLSHKTLAVGLLPLPSLLASIQEFPRPSLNKELQAYLGMVNSGIRATKCMVTARFVW